MLASLGKKTFSDAAGAHYKMSNPQTLSKIFLNFREVGGQTRIVIGLIIPTFLRRSEFKLSTTRYSISWFFVTTKIPIPMSL